MICFISKVLSNCFQYIFKHPFHFHMQVAKLKMFHCIQNFGCKVNQGYHVPTSPFISWLVYSNNHIHTLSSSSLSFHFLLQQKPFLQWPKMNYHTSINIWGKLQIKWFTNKFKDTPFNEQGGFLLQVVIGRRTPSVIMVVGRFFNPKEKPKSLLATQLLSSLYKQQILSPPLALAPLAFFLSLVHPNQAMDLHLQVYARKCFLTSFFHKI